MALVLVTVAVTVLVVLQLAPVVLRTTTRSVHGQRWSLRNPTSPRLPPLKRRQNSSNSPQTPQRVVLAKVHAAAMAVRRPLVLFRVPTVERRQPHSGAATTSGTIFAMLVVRCSFHSS